MRPAPRQFVPLSGDRLVNLSQVCLIEPDDKPVYVPRTGERLAAPVYWLRLANGANVVVNGRDARRVILNARRPPC